MKLTAAFAAKQAAAALAPKPQVTIRLRAVIETWNYKPMGGFGYQATSTNHQMLEIIAYNSGDTLLQHVQGCVMVPRLLLLDYIQVSDVNASIEKIAASEPKRIQFSNKLSDPTHNYLAPPKPAEWRPISPGVELRLMRTKLIPIGETLRKVPAEIKWEVAADSARLQKDSLQLRDLDIIDRRTKK